MPGVEGRKLFFDALPVVRQARALRGKGLFRLGLLCLGAGQLAFQGQVLTGQGLALV